MIYEDFSSLDHTKTHAQYTACNGEIYESALRRIDDENVIRPSLGFNWFYVERYTIRMTFVCYGKCVSHFKIIAINNDLSLKQLTWMNK